MKGYAAVGFLLTDPCQETWLNLQSIPVRRLSHGRSCIIQSAFRDDRARLDH